MIMQFEKGEIVRPNAKQMLYSVMHFSCEHNGQGTHCTSTQCYIGNHLVKYKANENKLKKRGLKPMQKLSNINFAQML